jgi:dipeptidyl aminopeptidase/acylaminoacyl peptidase
MLRSRIVTRSALLGLAGITVAAIGAVPASASTSIGPTGHIVYYGVTAPGVSGLLGVRPDGTGRKVLIRERRADVPENAAYSPDLRTIVYGEPGDSIWTMHTDGTGRVQILPPPDTEGEYCATYCGLRKPRFSPDGQQIAMLYDYGDGVPPRLFVFNSNGSNLRIYRGSWDWFHNEGEITWSPDSTRIAYTARPDDETYESAIFTTDVRTGETRQLTKDVTYKTAPEWSPDGRTIAYSGTDGIAAEGWELPRDLYALTVADGTVRRVTNTPELTEASPTWAPNSAWLAYDRYIAGTPGSESMVRITRVDGTHDRSAGGVQGDLYGWTR